MNQVRACWGLRHEHKWCVGGYPDPLTAPGGGWSDLSTGRRDHMAGQSSDHLIRALMVIEGQGLNIELPEGTQQEVTRG